VAGAGLRAADRSGRADANLVERLTAEGHTAAVGDLTAAEAVLGRARGYGGSALAEFVYEEFAQDHIRHLTDIWLQGTENLAEVKLGLGDDASVLSLAEAAIREDPLRERSRRLQLLSLYRTKRAAEALRAYESFRRCLADELGIEPSPELQHLHEAILIHDPALDSGRGRRDAAAPGGARNPYKGLRAFGEADAGDFFGREVLVHRLFDALAGGSRLVTLVGPSGSGKSSVLSAGLIPALGSAVAPGSDRWVVARMRPGAHPLEALRVALTASDSELLLVIDQSRKPTRLPNSSDEFLRTRPGWSPTPARCRRRLQPITCPLPGAREAFLPESQRRR
jgi:hypothetical protein